MQEDAGLVRAPEGAASANVALELPTGWKLRGIVPISFGHEDESFLRRFPNHGSWPPFGFSKVRTSAYMVRVAGSMTGVGVMPASGVMKEHARKWEHRIDPSLQVREAQAPERLRRLACRIEHINGVCSWPRTRHHGHPSRLCPGPAHRAAGC
jgi:hypothetical protein